MIKLIEENLELISDWIERSTQFAKTDKNFDLLVKYIKSEVRSGHEVTVEMLNAFIAQNSEEFEWLATPEMLAQIRQQPTKPEPEKLRGSTADKLYQLGIIPTRHLSHRDRQENDSQSQSVISQMAQAAAKTRADIERQEQIAEARNIVVYRPGPNGRLDHGATESARIAALAKLGVTE